MVRITLTFEIFYLTAWTAENRIFVQDFSPIGVRTGRLLKKKKGFKALFVVPEEVSLQRKKKKLSKNVYHTEGATRMYAGDVKNPIQSGHKGFRNSTPSSVQVSSKVAIQAI